MSRSSIHRDSVEFLKVEVTAPADVTIAAQPVAFAFMAGTRGDPAPADWKAGAWVPAANPPTARILVGPPALTLAPGVYTVYVKITDSPEVPVLRSGTITVT